MFKLFIQKITMHKTKKVNAILNVVDNSNLLYEEFERLILELEAMQEEADSIDDIETQKWFDLQKEFA